jgi:aspartyl-tRNA(Asn)/glutamyl-tRNA(Gln) amidotransferase subunit A
VMAEPDARDWSALPPPAGSYLDGLEDGMEGLRVAFSADLGHVDVDAEVAGLVASAAEAFGVLGAHVEALDPGFADPREDFDVLWSAGAAAALPGLGDPPESVLDPGLAEMAAFGRSRSVLEYLAASKRRDELGILMSRFHDEWDLLLTPTLPLAAFEAGREVPGGWSDRRWPSWTPFTYPFNLTQQPAASVPCGFTAAGLPVGLQIVGPRHADARVLRAARAYEAAHPQPTLPN